MKITPFTGQVTKRIKRIIESRILKRWGRTSTKKLIWDKEFSSGQWDYCDHTSDDPIYAYLEKYSNNGSILDLGCGSGNTGNEMDFLKYGSYTGVDISESAIEKALNRSKNNRRQEKNEYVCADISLYAPKKGYNIILFRESIFYIPKYKIKGVLGRYADYLSENGLFIVRMCHRKKYRSIARLIENNYYIVDRYEFRSPEGNFNIILVFK